MAWNIFRSPTSEVFCAFCRSKRKVYRRRSVGVVGILALFVLTMFIIYLISGEFDPRAILLLVFGVILAEILVHFRWRLSLVCKECGFDPIVYKRDPEKAASRVKERLEQREQDVTSLFRPPLELPPRKLEKKETRGRNLSRHV